MRLNEKKIWTRTEIVGHRFRHQRRCNRDWNSTSGACDFSPINREQVQIVGIREVLPIDRNNLMTGNLAELRRYGTPPAFQAESFLLNDAHKFLESGLTRR